MIFIDPDREQFSAFAKMAIEGPVDMLNLIKLRDEAAYQDGQTMSGREAYAAYGKASAPFFEEVGGKIVWRGVPQAMVIGPADEQWDIGFVARYPSKDAFLTMVKNEGYQRIVHHRQAAVLTSRLYAFAALDGESAKRFG
ncbi:MAG: DUF1330 domain-containing protein [Parvularcula sp.]|jgi:uncharacterized protein (DUF1330 family)|nr:DUF1330 domain-containing protein [Parvularcula sp.]